MQGDRQRTDRVGCWGDRGSALANPSHLDVGRCHLWLTSRRQPVQSPQLSKACSHESLATSGTNEKDMDFFLLIIPGDEQGTQTEKEQPGEGGAEGRGGLNRWPPCPQPAQCLVPLAVGPQRALAGSHSARAPGSSWRILSWRGMEGADAWLGFSTKVSLTSISDRASKLSPRTRNTSPFPQPLYLWHGRDLVYSLLLPHEDQQ